MHKFFKGILILIITLQACNEKNPIQDLTKINLSGQITGLADTTLQFSYESYKLLDFSDPVDIIVDSTGYFNLILDTQYPLKGFLSFGKVPRTYKFDVTLINGEDSSMQVGSVDFRMVYFYLSPGDSLFMKVDANRIRESLDFKGRGSENNIFVNQEDWQFNSYKNKYLNNYYDITYYKPDEYKSLVQDMLLQKQAYLEDYNQEYGLSDHLEKLYSSTYEQAFIRSMIAYPGANAGFNDGRKASLPNDYFGFLDDIVFPENIDNLGVSSYYYLNSVLRKKHDLAVQNNTTALDFYDYATENLTERMAYVFKAYALDRDFNKELYDLFDESCPYPDIAKLVKSKYGHLEGMLAGNPFPDFKLEDKDGRIFTPEDFKGDFVYIDFWATWCKPCIKEIPFLEELQEEYKNYPIKFISISIDKEKDKAKWQDFVKENNMKGIQLWASSEHQDLFSKSLNIKSIPRFVLLDKEGKIVEAQALRPSNNLLKEVLENLL